MNTKVKHKLTNQNKIDFTFYNFFNRLFFTFLFFWIIIWIILYIWWTIYDEYFSTIEISSTWLKLLLSKKLELLEFVIPLSFWISYFLVFVYDLYYVISKNKKEYKIKITSEGIDLEDERKKEKKT